jgi:hypothetical protein
MASEGVCLDEGGRRSQQCAVVLATVAAGAPSQQLQLLASDALMTQLVAWLHSPADQARRAPPPPPALLSYSLCTHASMTLCLPTPLPPCPPAPLPPCPPHPLTPSPPHPLTPSRLAC